MLPVVGLQARECESLMRVVQEQTAFRSKLVAGKSVMAERFAELQQESISRILLYLFPVSRHGNSNAISVCFAGSRM